MSYAGVLFPVEVPRVTLPFADRSFRVYRDSPHRGVDLAPWPGSTGRPVRASIEGVITDVNLHGDGAAIGNEVVALVSLPYAVGAEDLEGNYHEITVQQSFYLRYGHLETVAVSEGQRVRAGERIGTIGSTGMAFGPHLHLEVRLGAYEHRLVVDPMHVFIACIVGLKGELQSL